MYAYAMNRIQRPNKDDPKLTDVVAARTVFEAGSDQFKELERLGAARKATNEEIAVYKDQQARATGQAISMKENTVAEAERVGDDASNDSGTVQSKTVVDDTADKADTSKKTGSKKSADDNMLG